MTEQFKKKEKEKWYAVVTRPKAEKKVYARLLEMNFNSYLPLVVSIKQWSDRKKRVESPLIPSYVFVKTEERNLSMILGELGVVRVFKFLKKPAVILESEIEILKILVNDSENVTVLDAVNFCKGERVKIMKGPFLGMEAECIQFQGKHRIIIRTVALGVVMEVNIPMSFVEKIDIKATV